MLAAWREARPIFLPGDFEDYDAFAARAAGGLVESARNGHRVLVVAHARVFVVLDQLTSGVEAGFSRSIGNAEGRRVMVEPDGRLTVGDPLRVSGPSGFTTGG